MNKMFAAVVLLMAGNVQASVDVITCEQYGYTNDPEKFQDIETHQKQTVFKVGVTSIVLGTKRFDVVDPAMFDMEGLAVVYKDSKNNQLLYLYMNEEGEREVGVSRIEDASDTFFEDKSVYKQCTLAEDEDHGSTESVLRTANRRTENAQAVYSF